MPIVEIPKRLLIGCIRLYALIFSPWLGAAKCRFYPTCSRYAAESIENHGVLKGAALTIKRLSRCHPWHKGTMMDPVPPSIDWKDIIGYKLCVCSGVCKHKSPTENRP